ncbi:hypothetical protein JCM8547_003974 [Rhodosporidiobolus lusitaniae]
MSTPYSGTGDYAYPPHSSSTANLTSGEKVSNMHQRSSFSPTVAGKSGNKKKLWWIVGAAVAIVVILAAVLGGVLGSRAANEDNKSASEKAAEGGSGSGSGTRTSSGAGASATPAGPLVDIVDLPAWTWGTNKSIGMCLGSWLIIEKWMIPDWFNETVNAVQAGAGATTLDEWGLCEVLGQEACKEALTEHMNNFVTEDDIQSLYEHGINHIRIPTGFWAWVPTEGDEPYVNDTALYQGQIERVLKYTYDRGMYVFLDMHGLPGSQNGEQSSGHLTTSPSWFGPDGGDLTTNQQRSDNVIKAVTDWVAQTPYRSVITGIEPINEPRPYTDGQYDQIKEYYERSYQTIQASQWPVATIVPDAYYGFDNLTAWVGQHVTTPPSVVAVDHPYPGNFPPQNNTADILSQVCSAADRYLNFPVPILIDEWSIYTGVKDQDFEEEFYKQQLVTWAWSAGGTYWSYKLITSQQDLANGLDYSQYSWATLLSNNSATIGTAGSYGLSSTTNQADAQAYIDALTAELTSSCGTIPDNVAPYDNGTFTVQTWSQELAARTSAAGQTLTATSTSLSWTAAPTATVRAKRAVPL